eukprot:TRINITY_DN12384_c0_g1_i1.p1 TRINITY_DN12384_c0_g1~~TRINITY_DN12384_c0_g1_i1.p1  ORF type:complete len:594 (-),score=125.14 TRINITY_DN12384_c0_g1_i1:14-1756(-)
MSYERTRTDSTRNLYDDGQQKSDTIVIECKEPYQLNLLPNFNKEDFLYPDPDYEIALNDFILKLKDTFNELCKTKLLIDAPLILFDEWIYEYIINKTNMQEPLFSYETDISVMVTKVPDYHPIKLQTDYSMKRYKNEKHFKADYTQIISDISSFCNIAKNFIRELCNPSMNNFGVPNTSEIEGFAGLVEDFKKIYQRLSYRIEYEFPNLFLASIVDSTEFSLDNVYDLFEEFTQLQTSYKRIINAVFNNQIEEIINEMSGLIHEFIQETATKENNYKKLFLSRLETGSTAVEGNVLPKWESFRENPALRENEAMDEVSFKSHRFSIVTQDIKKLRLMYSAYLKKILKDDEISVGRYDPDFLIIVFCLLCRYNTFQPDSRRERELAKVNYKINYQTCLVGQLCEALNSSSLKVEGELFSSFFNTSCSRYLSAFSDLEWILGCTGSIIDGLSFTNSNENELKMIGSFMAYPPQIPYVIEKSLEILSRFLNTNNPLSILFFIEDTLINEAQIDLLKEAGYVRFVYKIPSIKLMNIPTISNRHKCFTHKNNLYSVILLQNEEGNKGFPIEVSELSSIFAHTSKN